MTKTVTKTNSTGIDLVYVSGKEPTVRDIDLAERLGFGQARDIRKLIERNLPELETYGALARHGGASISGKGRQMDVDEYHLNEAQALLICMFSRTEKAAEVRREVIKVYMAYRRRQVEHEVTWDMQLLRAQVVGVPAKHAARITSREKANIQADYSKGVLSYLDISWKYALPMAVVRELLRDTPRLRRFADGVDPYADGTHISDPFWTARGKRGRPGDARHLATGFFRTPAELGEAIKDLQAIYDDLDSTMTSGLFLEGGLFNDVGRVDLFSIKTGERGRFAGVMRIGAA